MKYSKYQKDIFDCIDNINDCIINDKHLVIEAGPGSGKTTTLVKACDFIPKNQKIILVSFSRLIADTLATSIPRHAESNTLNAHAWRVYRDNVKNVQLDKFKDVNLYKQYVNQQDWCKSKAILLKLVGLLKNNLISDEIITNMLNLAREHAIELPLKILNWNEIFEKVYIQSINNIEVASFDDQKFQPIYRDWEFKEYDWELVDETQDLSLLDIEIVAKILGKNGHGVFVGDKKQAIYLFRGSSSDAMDKIVERFKAKELPLPICYRCPTRVIDEARKIYPDIEHPEVNSNGEGLVETINKNIYEGLVAEGDFVLSRTTAPLIKYCLRMLSLKKRAYVKGREIGEGLIKLIDNISDNKNLEIHEFDEKLTQYGQEQIAHLAKLNREDAITLLEDQIEGLKAFFDSCHNVMALKAKINEIIVDSGAGIVFMTLHKSKGLENPNIFIIRRDLIPHPRSKTDAQLVQEKNLLFIGITRSQQTLRFVLKDPGER